MKYIPYVCFFLFIVGINVSIWLFVKEEYRLLTTLFFALAIMAIFLIYTVIRLLKDNEKLIEMYREAIQDNEKLLQKLKEYEENR